MSQTIIQSLLNPALQKFIKDHELDDEKSLVLKHKTIKGIQTSLVAEQISGRKKAKSKLPTFYKTFNIIYPPSINMEQCSSEATATFKFGLINKGEKFVDLTGGYGVDTFFLSKKFSEAYYIEPDLALLEIARYNHKLLGALNIHHQNISAEKFLSSLNTHCDLVFIDPSRRPDGNKKVFKLSDCIPDITALQGQIFERAEILLIKTSPLLDLQQGLKELKLVEKLVVISVENECKEVLFLCRKGPMNEPSIAAVNLLKNGEVDSFSFLLSEERNAEIKFSDPLLFLYEPNASILKAGAFKIVANRFNLCKIHPSTHLYTTTSLVSNFPGKVFKIEGFVKPDPKSIKQYFPEGKANITTRNYPLSPGQLKKKTGLKDGGKKFLIGFSGGRQKFLVVALRIQ